MEGRIQSRTGSHEASTEASQVTQVVVKVAHQTVLGLALAGRIKGRRLRCTDNTLTEITCRAETRHRG
jgi:hypothetical protein